MVDFSQLLHAPAGEAKRPPTLPVGDYKGRVKQHEIGDKNQNKTPYVRYHLVLTDWPDTTPEAEKDGIDLTKRTLRRDFFLTEDAKWRLDQFLKSCDIEMAGKMYDEVIGEPVGHEVTVEVQQFMNQTTGEIGNQVGKLSGA